MREIYTKFVRQPEGKGKLGIPERKRQSNVEKVLKKECVKMWTRFSWLWMRSSGRFL